MIKQIIILLVLSVLLILGMPYVQHGLEWIVAGHNWVSDTLTNVFSGSTAGDLIRKLIALLVIPFVIGLIPVIIYWIIKRSRFPHFMLVVWVIWFFGAGSG